MSELISSKLEKAAKYFCFNRRPLKESVLLNRNDSTWKKVLLDIRDLQFWVTKTTSEL